MHSVGFCLLGLNRVDVLWRILWDGSWDGSWDGTWDLFGRRDFRVEIIDGLVSGRRRRRTTNDFMVQSTKVVLGKPKFGTCRDKLWWG
jgi:hypothetical protein